MQAGQAAVDEGGLPLVPAAGLPDPLTGRVKIPPISDRRKICHGKLKHINAISCSMLRKRKIISTKQNIKE